MDIGYQILMILAIILCVFLTIVILSQDPKGGGLSGSFGGSGTQMFGAQKTNDFLDRATWVLASLITTLVIISNVWLSKPSTSIDTSTIQTEETTTIPTTEEAMPTSSK